MKSGVFDNRIETVLACRYKIILYILDIVYQSAYLMLEKV